MIYIAVMDYGDGSVSLYATDEVQPHDSDGVEDWLREHHEGWNDDQCSYMLKSTPIPVALNGGPATLTMS
jgi:hypothetical protein